MRARLLFLSLGALLLLALLWFLIDGGRNAQRAPELSAVPVESAGSTSTTTEKSAPTETTQREALVAEAGAARALELTLVRFPDDAPLAYVSVATAPPPLVTADGGLATTDDGRIALELPPGTAAIEVRVPGFEPARAALEPGARTQRLALVPSSGLFGRVLFADGSPAAGAALSLLFEERLLNYARHATRSQPHASVFNRQRAAAAAVANEHGYYYLPFATRTSRMSVDLRATTSAGLAEVRRVELPHEPVALADIVFGEPDRLQVRVIDLGGAPVAGAAVWSFDGPYPGTTDAEGKLAITAPHLPALISAHADGLWQRERRHDGVVVDARTKVESCSTRVELVLGPAPGAKLRIVDAETGLPIFLGNGRVELLRAGVVVGQSSFEPDKRGFADLRFFDLQKGPDAEPAELARITFEKEGYIEGTLELDPRLASTSEPVVLALEPEQSFRCLRGRVLRAGEPVPGLQVALKAQARSDGAEPRGWQYERTYSDDEGRFSLRWHDAPDLIVTVFPHWVKFEEFAFIGPLDAAQAAVGEHVLELQPAVRVPAILRGAAPEASYCYYVNVLDEEGTSDALVATTVNGAPLSLAGSGDVRTSLTLPSQRRVRVTIGYLTSTRVLANCSTPADYDPAHPVLPLVFELQPLFVHVQGRVVGIAADEFARLSVAFVQAGDEQARLTRPASDGSFEFPRLPLGKGQLYLVRQEEPESSAVVLARLELELTADRADLGLAPDPDSLPATPER